MLILSQYYKCRWPNENSSFGFNSYARVTLEVVESDIIRLMSPFKAVQKWRRMNLHKSRNSFSGQGILKVFYLTISAKTWRIDNRAICPLFDSLGFRKFPPPGKKQEEKSESKVWMGTWFFSDWTFGINLFCLRDPLSKKKFTIKLNAGLF